MGDNRLIWLSTLVIASVLLFSPLTVRSLQAAAVAEPPAPDSPAGNYKLYLPAVTANRPPQACAPIPGVSYAALFVAGPGRPNPDAEHDAGYNIGRLGYDPTQEARTLVFYNGPSDPNTAPPQLYTIFGDRRTPGFPNVYRLRNGDGTPITSPPVTFVGMQVATGEILHTPDSGYDIQYGYDALVIYASEQRIALNYTRNDNLMGYTVYIDNLCVEPSLLALYRQLDAAGRHDLPAVRGDQPLGRAWGGEIRVAIRDTGSAMDPRSCKDWWQGRCP